jgi:hypothetical protein
LKWLRPKITVVEEAALVPGTNLIQPAPNRFTHELSLDEPFRLDRSEPSDEPDGMLAAGTPVVLLVEGPEHCRVVDGTGLYVEVRRSSLRGLR